MRDTTFIRQRPKEVRSANSPRCSQIQYSDFFTSSAIFYIESSPVACRSQNRIGSFPCRRCRLFRRALARLTQSTRPEAAAARYCNTAIRLLLPVYIPKGRRSAIPREGWFASAVLCVCHYSSAMVAKKVAIEIHVPI